MQFTIRLAMLPNLRQPCLPVSSHCTDINLCSYLFSSQTDFKVIGHYHFVRPKLKGIGHFVRRLCKKYFKAWTSYRQYTNLFIFRFVFQHCIYAAHYVYSRMVGMVTNFYFLTTALKLVSCPVQTTKFSLTSSFG